MSIRTLLLVMIAWLLCLPSAEAQIFKWRDAAGKLHFSDTPPLTGESTETVGESEPVVQPGETSAQPQEAGEVTPGESTPSQTDATDVPSLPEEQGGQPPAPPAAPGIQ